MNTGDLSAPIELSGFQIILQREEHTCVPTCIKILLDFLSQRDPLVPHLTLEEISDIIETTPTGTTLEGIEKINKEFDKASCFLRLKNVTNANPTFKEIQKSLHQGFPPLVFVNIARLQGEVQTALHAILLIGIIPEKNKILYIDPYFGNKHADLGLFMESWEDSLRVLFVVERGKKGQVRLNKYIRGEEKDALTTNDRS